MIWLKSYSFPCFLSLIPTSDFSTLRLSLGNWDQLVKPNRTRIIVTFVNRRGATSNTSSTTTSQTPTALQYFETNSTTGQIPNTPTTAPVEEVVTTVSPHQAPALPESTTTPKTTSTLSRPLITVPTRPLTNTTRHSVGHNTSTRITAPLPVRSSERPETWLDEAHAPTTAKPYVAERDCGIQPVRREGRVVGGRDSLQDLKWVLTAAHCQPGMFGSLMVVVGQYDLSNRPGKMKPVVRKVKRMIVHRDYNPNNFDNDIALLELEQPYQLQPNVVPICLPSRDEEFFGQQAMVAGWGKLSFGGPVPNVLQVAKLPVLDNKQCQKMYHNSGHIKIISDSFLCAGYATGGRDSCEGDSGGPLQAQRRDSKWVLLGTVSHGIKCAEPNLPGIYIRTTAYLPWIKAVTYQQDYNKRYGHR